MVSLNTNSLSGWERTLDSGAMHKFAFRLGRGLAGSLLSSILSLAGKELGSVVVSIRSLSDQE